MAAAGVRPGGDGEGPRETCGRFAISMLVVAAIIILPMALIPVMTSSSPMTNLGTGSQVRAQASRIAEAHSAAAAEEGTTSSANIREAAVPGVSAATGSSSKRGAKQTKTKTKKKKTVVSDVGTIPVSKRHLDPLTEPFYKFYEHGSRPAGSLLLNMLIKNERDHLDRTLPAWAKIITAWVIGVDDANTDDSVEVIHRHLGHLPGRIVTVHFDGMGPTWSVVTRRGQRWFPHVTHGIMADADFEPDPSTFDPMELDIRCSKHLFSIFSESYNQRKLDWIYRNVKGAKVERRTHQVLSVPKLPEQEVFMTEVKLTLSERTGGYQDRTGGKMGKVNRYIGFLEADLVDYPDDPRTLYYLGVAYLDKFNVAAPGERTSEHWEALDEAIAYYERRVEVADLTDTNKREELWFTILRLGEIMERYKYDVVKARYWYHVAIKRDPERADPWFYVGQRYRLMGDPESALPYLLEAASLAAPHRSLFQWHDLYTCVAKVELARCVLALQPHQVDKRTMSAALAGLAAASCDLQRTGAEAAEVPQLFDALKAVKPGAPSLPDTLSERRRQLRLGVGLEDLPGASSGPAVDSALDRQRAGQKRSGHAKQRKKQKAKRKQQRRKAAAKQLSQRRSASDSATATPRPTFQSRFKRRAAAGRVDPSQKKLGGGEKSGGAPVVQVAVDGSTASPVPVGMPVMPDHAVARVAALASALQHAAQAQDSPQVHPAVGQAAVAFAGLLEQAGVRLDAGSGVADDTTTGQLSCRRVRPVMRKWLAAFDAGAVGVQEEQNNDDDGDHHWAESLRRATQQARNLCR